MSFSANPNLLNRIAQLRSPAPSTRQVGLGQGFVSRQHFAQVIEPHIPRMVSTARGILGTEDLAWDAVQETLMRTWVRGWLPECPEGALVHLVKKSSLHLLRCQRRRSVHEDSMASESPDSCCGDGPLAALESAERVQSVRDAVGGIAKEYREVLQLYAFQGQSYESIADRLNLPLGTVRSRLSRGRSLLRERLLAVDIAS